MVDKAADYSGGFPGASALKGAGFSGAVRYIGYPGNRKCATALELVDFSANGLGMALVHENQAGDWRGGAEAGEALGRRARDHATLIGFPADMPIYMAVDQDVIRSGEFATMVEYLRGANRSLGGVAHTGVYGEADVIDRARDAGVAAWFWQTTAWSGGRVANGIHLFQRLGTVNVNGVACDINEIRNPDWGQHVGDDVTKDEFKQWMTEWFESTVGGASVGGRNLRDATFQGAAWAAEGVTQIRALAGALTDDEANILAALAGARGDVLTAIAAIPPDGAPSDEQMDRLKEALKEGLGEDLAQVLGHKLIA